MLSIRPVSLAVLSLLAASQIQAQEGAGKRPKSQFLQQNEDWSSFRPGDDADVFDKVKHIAIGDGWAWLSFGGRAEARYESWRGFGFNEANDGDFLLTRALLHTDLHLGEGLRFWVEGKTAQSTNRSLPGGARTADVDTLAVQQAFVDWNVAVGDDSLRVRVGRQMFLFGAQRLVSPLPWANTLRTWDGISAKWTSGAWSAEAFATQFVPVRKYKYNRADDDLEFYGVYATRQPAAGERGLDVYLLGNTRSAVTINGTTGNERRHTLGMRSWGPLAMLGDGFDGEFEGAYQFGTVGAGDISAWSVTGVLGYRPADGSRVFTGVDAASGDSSSGGSVGTFYQLFPLGHAYFGLADTLARQNVLAAHAGFSYRVVPGTTAKIVAHVFRLMDTADAFYNVAGGVARTGLGSRDIGQEVDVLVTHVIDARTKLYAGYSHVFGGGGLAASGPNDEVDFLYVGAGWVF